MSTHPGAAVGLGLGCVCTCVGVLCEASVEGGVCAAACVATLCKDGLFGHCLLAGADALFATGRNV